MKRLIAGVVMSTALAIGVTGCAHQQLTNQQAARRTIVVGGTVALIILAAIGEGHAGPR